MLVGCQKSAKNAWQTSDDEYINLNGQNVALMWLAPDCPLCQLYSSEFISTSEQYGNDIHFYGVLPGSYYSNQEVTHFKDSFNFNLPLIKDPNFILTKRYGVTTTPEFVLLDSLGDIKYQGKFDDWATGLSQKKIKPTQFYFSSALENFMSNEPIDPKYTKPIGCIIETD